MAKENYKVELKKVEGTCDTPLFRKMAENGDITAEKVSEYVGKIVKINGIADCHIVAGDKEFDITYYSTSDGIISSGSEVFKDSVLKYLNENCDLKIVNLKTSKGITYKVSPILLADNTESNEF